MERYKLSQVNPLRWSKAEIDKRSMWRCSQHRHQGLSTGHQNCYNKYFGITERIGCIDIEASNLKANFGIILSWSIKTLDKDEIWYDCLTSRDLQCGKFDQRLTETLIRAMWNYDRLVGHYSSRFDLPFVRTRAIQWDLDFPEYGMIWHTDVWRIARDKLCLNSNRQGTVAQALQKKDIKTKIHSEKWLTVQFGNSKERREALDYIVDHNIKDVIQLEGNYTALKPYFKERRTSI